VSALLDRVRRFLDQHRLIAHADRVIAAVSGGSDSIALLHVLRALDAAGDLQLAGIAHFNHQLRPAADADARFVETVARDLGLRFVSGVADVRQRAAGERRSIEDAARAARHEFFERARVELAAPLVAVGHTRDDQAETFLLRMIRGAGPRGLSGMHPRSGHVVRPLLTCGRQELRDWLAAQAMEATDPAARSVYQYCDDETNADTEIPRNRVRAELMPQLAARFNPAIAERLAHEAELQREIWNWMDDASARWLAHPDAMDVDKLRQMPPALRRLVLWRAMGAVSGGRTIAFEHVANAVRLVDADAAEGSGLDVPGLRVQRIGRRLVLTNRQAARRSDEANLFRFPLSIPGEVRVGPSGPQVSVEPLAAEIVAPRATARSGAVAWIRGDLVQGGLAVRNRRPGDRFRPVGLGGSKKLQDLFVDKKVAQADRDWVPIVVDESDRIIWVAGYGIDESFQVTDASQAVLVLRLTRA